MKDIAEGGINPPPERFRRGIIPPPERFRRGIIPFNTPPPPAYAYSSQHPV